MRRMTDSTKQRSRTDDRGRVVRGTTDHTGDSNRIQDYGAAARLALKERFHFGTTVPRGSCRCGSLVAGPLSMFSALASQCDLRAPSCMRCGGPSWPYIAALERGRACAQLLRPGMNARNAGAGVHARNCAGRGDYAEHGRRGACAQLHQHRAQRGTGVPRRLRMCAVACAHAGKGGGEHGRTGAGRTAHGPRGAGGHGRARENRRPRESYR